MTGVELAEQVLEGEDPKEFLRRASAMQTAEFQTFLRAYLDAMFWSTTLPPFGECPSCGQDQVLDRWSEDIKEAEFVCRGCGEREPNWEPPMENNYSLTDLSDEFKRESTNDCLRFWGANRQDIQAVHEIRGYPSVEIAGHDFWLTRQGHGAGFGDGDWPEEIDDRLHEAASKFGEVNVYVGDDGKVYG
jgi:hypothetical protein